MTIIAWDGKTLAADKQSTCAGHGSTVTKIFRTTFGLVGFAGKASHARALLVWFNSGAILERWPVSPDRDNWADAIVICPNGEVREYVGNGGGHYELVEDNFCAMGGGRDYALAAMFLGKSAKEAVEVACALDITCGKGIDTLELA
ncbi:hypothetical protein GJ698_02135 [Pseudoduganella sp. FT26W]|uniref:Uncharacterized protein n=1 Tax=Duganella aquatilis TaxID=2666082 RepID=A0A844CSI0_9BURK|nr:hypothetical protein [Duganella aquatilis]MRW82888.1 hypothetical protein [Duganella aquatilis]